jgi:hypothetical protein
LYSRFSGKHAASSIFRVAVRRFTKLMGYIGFGGGAGRKILVENLNGRYCLGDLAADMGTILK